MKKLTLLTLVTICFLSSCTKSSTTPDMVDEAALSTVMSMKDNSQLVSAYAVLKPVEKLELWSRHIKYFIQSHNLNSEQLAFVMDFKNQWVVNNLFEKNSPLLKGFTDAIPQIKYKAQSLLGIPDAFSLLMDLPSDRIYYRNKYTTTNLGLTTVETDKKYLSRTEDCSCSRTDPYCNAGTCAATGCTNEGLGCGTLFLFTCNGNCSLI